MNETRELCYLVYIFVCIDFDRDYALPIKNSKHAISYPLKEQPKEILKDPKLSASLKGTLDCFEPFINCLTDFNLPSTFYFEARSLKLLKETNSKYVSLLKKQIFEHGVHGFDHEDLTGEETRISLNRDEETHIIKRAQVEIESILDTKVYGFRAPYMKNTANTFDILNELNIRYDSSLYVEAKAAIKPYKINGNLMEFPVIKTPKQSIMKGMYTYLWPLFEGKRKEEDVISNYLQLVKNSQHDDSYISINLHSWHFSYNISQGRYLSKMEIQKNVRIFENLISKLQETGKITLSTPKKWLEER